MPIPDSGATLMALLVLIPLVTAVLVYLVKRDWVQEVLVLTAMAVQLFVAFQLAGWVVAEGPQLTRLGGHPLPLAIALRADGLASLMVGLTAVVCAATAVYVHGWAAMQPPARGQGMRTLLLILCSGMTALFLADDLFNLYVTLEVATLSAVALVILSPKRVAAEAALRYLIMAMLGSIFYLLAVALVYAQTGTLAMQRLSGELPPTMVFQISLLLMTAGLGIKAALFPMHAWLPAAHSAAPSPASALLSALVAKGAVYLILRIWTGPFVGVWTPWAAQGLAAIGIAGTFYASAQALRQVSIKRVVAYSTVAQLGYLPMLMALPHPDAWLGAAYLAMSHGLAKAAMFLAAGNLIAVYGNDRIDRIGGAGRRMGANTLALGIAAISLIGLPPSGGFLAKWWLIHAALMSNQWWWAVALLAGSLMTAGYLLRLFSNAMRELEPTERRAVMVGPPLRQSMLWPPLVLAVMAIGVSFFGVPLCRLITVGRLDWWLP